MSLLSGLIRGCFGAALGFKTEENENVVRIYGFEGEPGRHATGGRPDTNLRIKLPPGPRLGYFTVLW